MSKLCRSTPWRQKPRPLGHTMFTKFFSSVFIAKLSIEIREKLCQTSGNRISPLIWPNFGQCQDTTFLSFLKGLFDYKFCKYVIGLGIDRLFQSVLFRITLQNSFLSTLTLDRPPTPPLHWHFVDIGKTPYSPHLVNVICEHTLFCVLMSSLDLEWPSKVKPRIKNYIKPHEF